MIRDVTYGIILYLEALGFISKHGLWRYFLYSGIIGLFILGLIYFLVKSSYGWLSAQIVEIVPWESGFINSVSDWLSIAAISIFFFLVYKHLMLILTAPVMSQLSEKTEDILEGEVVKVGLGPLRIIKEMIRGARIALRNIVREIFLTIVLLILGLIPVFSAFAAPLIFALQSYYAGYGNYDFWAERHFSYSDTLRFMKDHRPMLLGNGIPYTILLAIPVLGVFVAPPLATIAATIHAHKRYISEV